VGLPDGYDLKDGGKGYTVLPPSLHPKTGKPYRWEERPTAPLTAGLLKLLQPEPISPRKPGAAMRSTKQLAGLFRVVGEAPTGKPPCLLGTQPCIEAGYNDKVLDDLCQLARDRGLLESEVRNALRQATRTSGELA
jgi:hypothetical protein